MNRLLTYFFTYLQCTSLIIYFLENRSVHLQDGGHKRRRNQALLSFLFILPSSSDSVGKCIVFRLSHLFIRLSDHILLPRCLMNYLNHFDKNDREYSLAHTDDLIRFKRSKVKVTPWQAC